jgi:hypothetical protein
MKNHCLPKWPMKITIPWAGSHACPKPFVRLDDFYRRNECKSTRQFDLYRSTLNENSFLSDASSPVRFVGILFIFIARPQI